MRGTVLLATALLLAVPVTGLTPYGVGPSATPDAAAGFTVTPLTSVEVPTAITFGPGDGDGPDLYASTLAGEIVRVHLTWTPTGPVATERTTFATGFNLPLGVTFVNGDAYVSDSHPGTESGRVDGVLYRLHDGNRTAVVDGLPNGRHNLNNLVVAPDGRLILPNGNPNDDGVDGGPADVFPVSGAILAVDPSEVATDPVTLHWETQDGEDIPPNEIYDHPRNDGFRGKVDVVAHGFRNIYDVAYSPTGDLYTAMNGADDPSSQDALYHVEPGTNYSFPACYNAGPPGGVGADVHVVNNPMFPGHDCSSVEPATALLGWHVCATGVDVATAEGAWAFPAALQGDVFVAECGPFFADDTVTQLAADEPGTHDPTHDTGHKVTRVRLNDAGDAVAVDDFVTGLALPTDVAFGPDGAMYIADAGAVHRVAPAVPGVVATGS